MFAEIGRSAAEGLLLPIRKIYGMRVVGHANTKRHKIRDASSSKPGPITHKDLYIRYEVDHTSDAWSPLKASKDDGFSGPNIPDVAAAQCQTYGARTWK